MPLALGSPLPFAAPAALLVPFFLGPSVGGPIGCGAGVPPAAGVAGLESEAFSALDTGAAGRVVDVAGESFASLGGVSSFTSRDSGSTIALSLSVGTCNVTVRLDLLAGLVLRRVPLLVPLTLPPDLRRSLAMTALLAEDPMRGELLVLLEGAMRKKAVGLAGSKNGWDGDGGVDDDWG